MRSRRFDGPFLLGVRGAHIPSRRRIRNGLPSGGPRALCLRARRTSFTMPPSTLVLRRVDGSSGKNTFSLTPSLTFPLTYSPTPLLSSLFFHSRRHRLRARSPSTSLRQRCVSPQSTTTRGLAEIDFRPLLLDLAVEALTAGLLSAETWLFRRSKIGRAHV